MAQDIDPVGSGVVASLARPGGNITGLSTLAPEIGGKQLELLKEIVPRLVRAAVIGTSTIPGNTQRLKEIELAAGAFNVQLKYLDVLGPKDIETAFQAASKEHADALLLGGAVLNSHRTQVIQVGKEPAPGDIRQARLCGRRGPCVLRRELYRLGPARRHLRGQDIEGKEARRSSRRAADKVRADDQP